jgi:hypothetical protein
LQIPPSLNSKAILQRARLLFLLHQHWRALNFFRAPTFLSMPTFFHAQSFYHPPKILDALGFYHPPKILDAPSFYHPPKILDAPSFYHLPKILKAPMFLDAPMFLMYFAVPIFLYMFLHPHLVCINNFDWRKYFETFRLRLFLL